MTTPRPFATTKPSSYVYEVEVGTDVALPPWIERDKVEYFYKLKTDKIKNRIEQQIQFHIFKLLLKSHFMITRGANFYINSHLKSLFLVYNNTTSFYDNK